MDELNNEIAWIMDTDYLFLARQRFQQKKLTSVDAGKLHLVVYPVLYDNEFAETRSQVFVDAATGVPPYT